MTRSRLSTYLAATCIASLAWTSLPARAQTPYGQSPFIQRSATPDADALADEMRLLATNPANVNAMVRAGELTLKLDDATAAAGFFARAERIDPNNPRIKAGKARLLVQSGRPGEALRLFAEAERLRGDVGRFAADRALAYDLIGEQERAQRDYRLALKDGPADETLRRYALSLGISGKQVEALEVIDPLLRRSDRGAWRARAFILAMNGDARGAERIAASMMPGGLGQGLQPFFDRLPRLAAADRAFAVHFGEVRSSPQRMADARLTPPLAALQPEPGRPVVLAAAAVQPVRQDRQGKRERRKRGRERVELATLAPPVPLPQPPPYQAPSIAVASLPSGAPTYVQPRPAGTRPVYPGPISPAQSTIAAAPVVLAANRAVVPGIATGRLQPAPRSDDAYRNATAALSNVPARAVPPAASAAQVVAARPQIVEAVPVAAPVQLVTATQPAMVTPAPIKPMIAQPMASTPPPAQSAVMPSATVQPATRSMVAPVVVTAPTPASVAAAAAPIAPVPTPVAATVLPPVPGPVKGEDSILARIIANITVPGSELDAAAETASAPVAPAPAVPTAVATAAPSAVPVAAADAQATLIAEQKAADRLANEKALADRRAAEKRAADRKLAEAKALADASTANASVVITRKPGESARAFDARKLAAARLAEEAEAAAIGRKPGETKRQFDARKLAMVRPPERDEVPALSRKPGESARQFEARKRSGQSTTDDDTPALTRRSGESTRQFETRKLAAARAAEGDDDQGVTRKPGESSRQFEARRLAAIKKATSDKKDAKPAEPARIWVQVAGGANERDLAKAWDKVRNDAPIAMRGRAAWTTPLRATNRVLTGPFKTEAEARSLVNALGKEGVSAFTFTSETGQKVSRLAGK